MLKERARILTVAIVFLDLLLVLAAFFAAYWLRDQVLPQLAPAAFAGPFYPLSDYLPLLPVVLAIWGSLLLSSGSYRSHRTVPLLDEAWSVVRVCFLGAAILTLTIFALRLGERFVEDQISRSWILLFALVSCLFLLTEKLAIRLTSRYVRSRGLNYRTVLIVGSGQTAVDVARSIVLHRFWGFRLLGLVATGGEGGTPGDEAVAAPAPHLLPVLGTIDDIPRLIEEHPVDDVIFAVRRQELDRMEEIFESLQELGIRTRFAMDLFPRSRARVQLEELDGIPLLTFSTTPTSHLQLMAKRLLDVGLATLLLALGLPLVVLIALAIKLTSGGTVLFRQTRCGLNGRVFTLYKFRTMVHDAEQRRFDLEHLNEMRGPAFKLRRDPRVTPLGRLLRKFSLDELPQLWNVLRGDMSLVGPRPPIPEEVAQYQRWQRRRLSMKPGLTCLWQISGRNHVDFDRWMQLDLEYIDSWSPMLDLKILVKTIPVVLTGRGAS
ncbi:MAG TPA: sugar transferase [Thermoanaerobaculia bacterium]|nr:sugar transferase [Thermoanaerobaculia bacterium]